MLQPAEPEPEPEPESDPDPDPDPDPENLCDASNPSEACCDAYMYWYNTADGEEEYFEGIYWEDLLDKCYCRGLNEAQCCIKNSQEFWETKSPSECCAIEEFRNETKDNEYSCVKNDERTCTQIGTLTGTLNYSTKKDFVVTVSNDKIKELVNNYGLTAKITLSKEVGKTFGVDYGHSYVNSPYAYEYWKVCMDSGYKWKFQGVYTGCGRKVTDAEYYENYYYRVRGDGSEYDNYVRNYNKCATEGTCVNWDSYDKDFSVNIGNNTLSYSDMFTGYNMLYLNNHPADVYCEGGVSGYKEKTITCKRCSDSESTWQWKKK